MQVKHNHNCLLCNTQKTCFVFSDFAMLFSICRSCYDELVANMPLYEVQDARCSFCEKTLEVKQLDGFDNAFFFSDIFMCKNCFDRIESAVEHTEG